MSSERDRFSSKFFGGRVCLDFANTLNWRLTGAPVELIPDYAAFLTWSEERGTVSSLAASRLLNEAAAHLAEAQAFMRDVHGFRAGLIEVADALWKGQGPDIAGVNALLSGLPPQPQLAMEDTRFLFDLDGSDLHQPLWPILWSLTAVLSSSDAGRIGCCQADGCGWFFVDESPNHSRLWCSDGCGNRERVRRSQAKRRGHAG